jgi:hypothetical protein
MKRNKELTEENVGLVGRCSDLEKRLKEAISVNARLKKDLEKLDS